MPKHLLIPVLQAIESEEGLGLPSAWVRCRIGGETLLRRAISVARRLPSVADHITVISDVPEARAEAKRAGVGFAAAPDGWNPHRDPPPEIGAIGLQGQAVILSPRLPLVSAEQVAHVLEALQHSRAVEVVIRTRHHPMATFRPTKSGVMDFSATQGHPNWASLDELQAWNWSRLLRGVNTEGDATTQWLEADEESLLVVHSNFTARLADMAASRTTARGQLVQVARTGAVL